MKLKWMKKHQSAPKHLRKSRKARAAEKAQQIAEKAQQIAAKAAEDAEKAQQAAMNATEAAEAAKAEHAQPTAEATPAFDKEILDAFRTHVGKFPAETGGLLASKGDKNYIDCHVFDKDSSNTAGTFYYNVAAMNKVFHAWRANGYQMNGVFHSHPRGFTSPSYHDISTALLHLRFLHIDYFYLPIIMPKHDGCYRLYFYRVTQQGDRLQCSLLQEITALPDGSYHIDYEVQRTQVYSIAQLDAYRASIDAPAVHTPVTAPAPTADAPTAPVYRETYPVIPCAPKKHLKMPMKMPKVQVSKLWRKKDTNYFQKVDGIFPEAVRNKVLIFVGCGGSRSAIENAARCGMNNFVLFDADVVSASNVATQGVYASEIGKKKVSVLKKRILDINPKAKVVCVDRFLDDTMSDQEFAYYLKAFHGKEPTDFLLLACTDNHAGQARCGYLALQFGMAYLAATIYQEGLAAEIIFTYPGVTQSCPRCLLRTRFEANEQENPPQPVSSEGCDIFVTERLNATKGNIIKMLLMYHCAPGSVYNNMLDGVKDRNFVWVRLQPDLSPLGIRLFDKAFAEASKYTFCDETIWVPFTPDSPKYGVEACKLCGGTGDLRALKGKYKDTRKITA